MVKRDSNKIIKTKVKDLKEYDKNSKKHPKVQVDKIINSISSFGFKNPILIDRDYNIIAGHGRVLAAKKLKLKEVPTIMIEDLTDSEIKAYRIADNKTAESEWDMDFLKEEMLDLKNQDYDLELTGFDKTEYEEILMIDDKEIIEDEVDVDAYTRAKNKTKIKLGDIFKLGSHRLMCGDSTKEETVRKLMDGNKAILMVTDPPYGVNYDPKGRDEADKKGILGNKYPTRSLGEVKNDDRIDWSEAWDLFNGNVVYVYHAGLYSNIVAKSLQKSGFETKSQIIWVKPHFALSRGDYHWKHEPIWYAVRKGKKHNWQGSRKEHTIWEIAGMNAMGASHAKEDEATGHGTQKPVQCMAKPILNSSNIDESVYDPFGGSGSTLIACEQLNRKCYMMELDPIYCHIIIERWEKLTNKKVEKVN